MRSDIFGQLPPDIQRQIGGEFQILPFNTRKQIISNLEKAGFDVGILDFEEEDPVLNRKTTATPKKNKSSNSVSQPSKESLSIESLETKQTENIEVEDSLQSKHNDLPPLSIKTVPESKTKSLLESLSKITSASPWKARLRKRKNKES